MDFMLRTYLSSFIILGVSACFDIEKIVGYEDDAVKLVFNVDVSGNIAVYQVTRTNVEKTSNLLTVVYNSDGSLDTLILNGGVDSIGNVSARNLSIRIPSMNSSFVGVYILKRTTPPRENITCYELLLRARPNIPVISNIDPSGNSVTGIEDKDITLLCRSTGGYPKPTMAWYRISNQTVPLATNTDQTQRDDRTYQLEYTFRAIRADDGATFICLSSYDPPSPLYIQSDIELNLSLKPSTPVLTIRNPLTESQLEIEIAECTTHGFKPKPLHISWVTDGTTTPASSYDTDFYNDTRTFRVKAALNSTISREQKGNALKCVVNHQSLDAPLEVIDYYNNIQYAPDVTVTTTNVTVNDSLAVLNCISSGKPTTYVFSEWQHIWPGYGKVDHNTRLGNDPILFLSALTYEFSGIYACTVSNGVSGSLRPGAGYGTVYLQVDTFPVITTAIPMRVFSNIGGTAVAYVDFYSTRPDNKVDCFRGVIQVDCYSEILNGDIELPVFGTIVPTIGSVASVSIDIHVRSEYGMYNIRISNGIGTSIIDIEIVPAEKQPENQNNTGAIVGGTVGASALVLGGIVFFVIWLKYTRQRTSKASGTSSSYASVERAGNSTENNASGIHLNLDGHKDVYYNIERNVYDELQERSGDTHEYEGIDRRRQIETSGPKNKEYDNLQLRCQTTS